MKKLFDKTMTFIVTVIIPSYIALIIILCAYIAFSGCTPQKRLDRLVKKHPHLSRIDTVKVTDTFEVMLPGIRADTNFTKQSFLSALKDTIILQKEQLTVKIYEYRDSVFIDAKCDTVYKTVIREVLVPYPTVTPNEKESLYKTVILPLSLIAVIYFVLYFTARYWVKK